MKGFAITPVLFLGLFIVVGLLMLNFSEIDMRLANSISKENLIDGLYFSAKENETVEGNLLAQFSVDAAVENTDQADAETYVENSIGRDIATYCADDNFTVVETYQFSKESVDSRINKQLTIQKQVTCSMVEKAEGEKAVLSCMGCTS